MTEITKNAIINRWKRLATEDLGSWITGPATSIWCFFDRILNNEIAGKFVDRETTETIAPWIRGFCATTQPDSEDCHLVMCLDLHFCDMSANGIEDFDHWLMSREPYSGAGRNFLAIWQDLVVADTAAKKNRGRRKK